ncbi:VPLPA-CTERM sorting domain-containing protein [uncultured Roseobacter sp.]|uniref:VPLPA-CTERM sorting domain-containing protein n=1 Tax=uncultured Roseobacter sp. TaxID=114847 RepID=UPI0026063E23|nr:VPLPA-CTERM sorting domain-containing protein [uncultured Roseobacter sp.]
MMKHTIIAAAAAMTMLAAEATAATLSGTYTINIRNFDDSDAPGDVVTRSNSAATRSNFDAQAIDAVIEYTGALDFGIGSGGSSTTTIDNFLTSAGGSYSVVSSSIDLSSTLLSQGSYVTTTFFEIFGSFAGNALNGLITHDDGITLEGNNVGGGVSAPPTSRRLTDFTADAGDFTLLYASANGNPSILRVEADISPVPLPAGAVLLMSGLAGLGIARRRKKS